MRIVSLVPAATEALFALGLGPSVVGVTHECDHPSEALALPRVTRSNLALEGLGSAAIEAAVNAAWASGHELYGVDTAAIRQLAPDLIVAQDVCAVCAVSADQLGGLEGVRVHRQHPHRLEEVLADIARLAEACDVSSAGVVAGLRDRISAVAAGAARRPRRRGVFLEWLDPPYRAGHWTPDLLAIAGIDDPLARAGVPSVPITWADIRTVRPELLILAPCGFGQERAETEATMVAAEIASVGAAKVAVLDGSAYFNRPGPRLVDSLELLDGIVAGPRTGFSAPIRP
ncbi:MAG: cobalamin-binding protein [Candidatus Dormibacteraceae bacterium]